MIRFTDFEALGVAVAAFTERSDGSCGCRDEARVADGLRARAAVAEACGFSAEALVCAQQVHGTAVAVAGPAERGRGATGWADALGPADSIVSAERGLPLAILVADCVPIYLFDPETGAGGVVHAGWRGTFDDAVGAAVAALRNGWGARPENMHALIGPSAGPCCYEVSEELARDFVDRGLATQGRRLDLWESNIRLLEKAGVSRARVQSCEICTICDLRFFSHRRDACGGRNMALLVL